jgi:post-segregation antitoxin (ccd killing protein)
VQQYSLYIPQEMLNDLRELATEYDSNVSTLIRVGISMVIDKFKKTEEEN